VKRSWLPVERWLRRNRVRDPVVYVGSGTQWPLAAGSVVQLFRDGRRVSVDPGYAFMFGKPFAVTGREDAAIVFADSGSRPAQAAGARVVARVGATTVYAKRLRPSASS
jgi:DNA-binding MurR/RpiR family transcriptional regulator